MTTTPGPIHRSKTYRGLRVRRVDATEWAVFHPAVRLTIRMTARGAFYLYDERGEPQTVALSLDGALNRALELYGRLLP